MCAAVEHLILTVMCRDQSPPRDNHEHGSASMACVGHIVPFSCPRVLTLSHFYARLRAILDVMRTDWILSVHQCHVDLTFEPVAFPVRFISGPFVLEKQERTVRFSVVRFPTIWCHQMIVMRCPARVGETFYVYQLLRSCLKSSIIPTAPGPAKREEDIQLLCL